MQKNLVIVESPAKAKTIEKFLGKDYKVMSSYGHIRDLKTKEFSIDIEHDYAPQYVIPADKKKLVSELKSEAKSAEQVWLASDEDRETMIRQAVNDGAEVIVCVGYLYGASLAWAAEQYPDVKFVAIDVTQGDIGTDEIPSNCYCITFKEEQAGYMAGYAVVKDGKTKLGFLGGMAVPAVIRYGYGFVQGASAAAAEMGVKVEMNYSWLYGASFSASTELQTMASGWYENGTEVIFSCGGSIFDSITAAASANDAAVIGVDVDQSYTSDTVITSALKGIGEAAQQALTAAYGSDWANYGGKLTTLGAAEGAVGLPTDTWSLKNWTVDQYKAMFEKIVKGEITIDNDFTKLASTDHVTLNLVK